jgi:hypothetical protein
MRSSMRRLFSALSSSGLKIRIQRKLPTDNHISVISSPLTVASMRSTTLAPRLEKRPAETSASRRVRVRETRSNPNLLRAPVDRRLEARCRMLRNRHFRMR